VLLYSLRRLYNVIGQDMARSSAAVFPLMNVFVRKVKVLKAPKVAAEKLLGETGDVGTAIQ
jgi:small subunit ribosomal protein S3Ae